MSFWSNSAFARSYWRLAFIACASAVFRALSAVSKSGVALIERCLKQERVEPGNHVALLHRRIEIGQDLLHAAGHLAAHLHAHDGRQRSAGRHLRDDGALIGNDRFVVHQRRGLREHAATNDEDPGDDAHDEREPHDSFDAPRQYPPKSSKTCRNSM